ncbi:MAG: class I SAM-dependent methyltransferase [Janthinobacterium lividum]
MGINETSSERPIIALGDWLDTPAGRYLRQWEQARLDQLTVDIFGFNAVQIGLPQLHGLQASRMTNRWVTGPVAWTEDAQAVQEQQQSFAANRTAARSQDSAQVGSSGARRVLQIDSSADDDRTGNMTNAHDSGNDDGAGHVDNTGSGALRRIAVAHDFTELPFASQSLDLVLLPHVLEFAQEPHQILREVERVLIAEGQVIICGFNPASMWGARQMARRLRGADFLPPHGELIGMPRLKDWLKLLNMEVGRGHFGCYAPACGTEKWLNRFHFMESVGERWWPFLGAVYIVQAIKRVKGVRLVGPAWTPKMAGARAGVPVARHGHGGGNETPALGK